MRMVDDGRLNRELKERVKQAENELSVQQR